MGIGSLLPGLGAVRLQASHANQEHCLGLGPHDAAFAGHLGMSGQLNPAWLCS